MKTSNPSSIVLTGIRPTSNLTIANYIGAIVPILSFQDQGVRPYVFVADLHALTDNEPEVLKYGNEILFDLLAAGVDPQNAVVYKQSSIANEIGVLTLLLARHVSVAELLRLPTLKEKVKSESVENANALLMMYPVMMAADILIQRSNIIPVGRDQEAHIEITRKIARRFNKDIANIFPEPTTHILDMIKILSLRGESKMSKSLPDDAIFLSEDLEIAKSKIKRAQTASAGEMTPNLESHILLINKICNDPNTLKEVEDIVASHMKGLNVMGDFKRVFSEVVINFLSDFQRKRNAIVAHSDEYMVDLQSSSQVAILHARETMEMVYKAVNL